MPLYEVAQNFNNNSAKIYGKINTDAITMQGLVALMPLGMSLFEPTASGIVGVRRAAPTVYSNALISCFDSLDRAYNTSYINLKYGKATLSDDDMVVACLAKVEVPNGTACDKVNANKIKRVGV
ncbi:MAG: hypothetical protein GW906_06310 [Epsilonproteobacteria bacterium]|nr:hypothetical protein [Campylobacterota bacterium]OIO17815.1 MAG: hypothetical protein AUJ81_01065 [Helicobacteraceae bacterium CG1_02_36_14]PIP10513.1 MAG: hypothetical protein COX50_05295 [Sulfurimonas sp. CG23_combo_of_CG06-09_8_20_14_all_36_33]PIS26963.1 MAG: hypothetical protein COT46_00570 [Sulfurimonas sp. CG08_land_8_20_14_0_20_36_33]PIU35857.1 MAG: hypothetical protein COT05_01545 [Sulfurimonas sp. CG07_land_8_20_14_0_80_36_56]PIV03434.1 MAG: hypothetical protein COS56_08400 [Sulfur